MSVYRIHNQGIWAGMAPEEMCARGLRIIDQLNEAFEFKYNEHFEKAKIKRINYKRCRC